MKVEAIDYGDKKVYTVAAFNNGVASYVARLPTLWIEGEVTELKRHARWRSVFFTLKDPVDGACLAASMPRTHFDALELELADGERVHVFGRAELYAAKGEFRLRALTIERFGLGDHLASIERLRKALAAAGLFDAARKRALPLLPRKIGLVTGNDAAAKHDVLTTIAARFPAAHVVVAETLVQGPRAAAAIVDALTQISSVDGVDVIVLARGGGSFEDLLPFSDERLVRAVATCSVPVVSAIGHEQDTPLCDLAADRRAATPTAAARLVVPDAAELLVALLGSRERMQAAVRRRLAHDRALLETRCRRLREGVRRPLERDRAKLSLTRERLAGAPGRLLERRRASLDLAAAGLAALSPRATLERGYAIVRVEGSALRDASRVRHGDAIAVELAAGALTARVEAVRP